MSDNIDEGVGQIVDDQPLLPPGEYELLYVNYETGIYWRTPKVVVNFAINHPESFAGTPVSRFYNAAELVGRPKRFGDFKASRRSDLVREYRRVVGSVARSDRLSFVRFKGMRILGRIETVQNDSRGRPLSTDDQYSRVAELLGVKTEECW
jgi:hypothetical protein